MASGNDSGNAAACWLEGRGAAKHIGPVPKGREIFRAAPSPWEEGGEWLLLNPRMPSGWRGRILETEFPDLPGHVWLASSGTGGSAKLVALSRAALEAGAAAVNAHLAATAADTWINPLPLFHVGGLGIAVRAALSGARWELFEGWDAARFARRAADCGATLSSLVPAQVHDIVREGLAAPGSLRAVVVGGGALEEGLRARAAGLGWPLLPSYGLTEACSQVATAALGAEDFVWLPLLPHFEARVGEGGALELSGPSLLAGWMLFAEGGAARWEDPKRGGWLRTADRAEVRGRELHPLGRLDDLVKIRGELVDLAALERALQARVGAGAVCLRARPDGRNGFALAVVAENGSAAAEARAALDVFPPFAVPDAIAVGEIVRSPLGKIVRGIGERGGDGWMPAEQG